MKVDDDGELEVVTLGCYNHGDHALETAGDRAAVVNSRSWSPLVAVLQQSRRPPARAASCSPVRMRRCCDGVRRSHVPLHR